jgi:hypothetical protein
VGQVECPPDENDCATWHVVARLATGDDPMDTERRQCFNRGVIVDGFPMTAQQMARGADAVVVARVLDIGPGFWDSATGLRPTTYSSEASILTPVSTEVQSTLKGNARTVEDAVLHGGEYGCDSEQYDPSPDLAEGLRYVMFLDRYQPHDRAAPESLLIGVAWPVGPDNSVRDPGAGMVTLEDLPDYLFED